MTTQTAVITGPQDLPGTKAVALFAVGGSTPLYTGTVSGLGAALGQWLCTFSSLVPAGVYVLILTHNGRAAATGQRVFTGTDLERAASGASGGSASIENQALMLAKLAIIQGAGFTGPHTVTVTVTAAGVGVLAGSRVSLERAGLSQTQTAGAGVAVFTLDPGTYTWRSTCAGYGGLTGSVVVIADAALSVILPPLVITPSGDPDLTTGFLVSLDTAGAIESGALYYCQLLRGPSGSGFGYDTEQRQATSAAVTGLVQFLGMVKGGVYYIWRGGKKDKTERLVPLGAASSWAIPSIAGKEAVV